jgi:hypothetical protein
LAGWLDVDEVIAWIDAYLGERKPWPAEPSPSEPEEKELPAA